MEGVIVRDGMGEVLATLLSLRDHITELDVAKTIGALRAVHLCHELGFYRVILEGDVLQVVQTLKKERSWSCYGLKF